MNNVGIIDLYNARISRDESGTSGRDVIWLAMFGSAYSQGGILQIFFGGGNGWPWWDFWNDNLWDIGVTPSSHNQWMSFVVNFGILGLGLFFTPIIIGIRNNLMNKNPINNIRIVIFACVFIESLSLEPLIFTPYIWFLLALITTYTPSLEEISEHKILE